MEVLSENEIAFFGGSKFIPQVKPNEQAVEAA